MRIGAAVCALWAGACSTHTGSRPVAATTEPRPAGVSVHPEAFRGLGRLAYASGNRVVILDGAGGAPQSFAFPGAVQRVRFSFDGAWLAAGMIPRCTGMPASSDAARPNVSAVTT